MISPLQNHGDSSNIFTPCSKVQIKSCSSTKRGCFPLLVWCHGSGAAWSGGSTHPGLHAFIFKAIYLPITSQMVLLSRASWCIFKILFQSHFFSAQLPTDAHRQMMKFKNRLELYYPYTVLYLISYILLPPYSPPLLLILHCPKTVHVTFACVYSFVSVLTKGFIRYCCNCFIIALMVAFAGVYCS